MMRHWWFRLLCAFALFAFLAFDGPTAWGGTIVGVAPCCYDDADRTPIPPDSTAWISVHYTVDDSTEQHLIETGIPWVPGDTFSVQSPPWPDGRITIWAYAKTRFMQGQAISAPTSNSFDFPYNTCDAETLYVPAEPETVYAVAVAETVYIERLRPLSPDRLREVRDE